MKSIVTETPASGLAHLAFLRAVGGDPKNLNLSYMSKRMGLKNNRLWFYANGKCRWKADQWFLVMIILGKLDVSELLTPEEIESFMPKGITKSPYREAE